MSGKEPPKGPRALRASGLGPSHPHHHQPIASSSSSGNVAVRHTLSGGRGAAPPTGPRSLGNVLASGRSYLQPPKAAYVNGFSRPPPSGPKGKSPAPPPSSVSPSPLLPSALSSAANWPNGRAPPTGPSALVNHQKLVNGTTASPSTGSDFGSASASTSSRAPISFALPGSTHLSLKSSPPPPKQPAPPPPPILPPTDNRRHERFSKDRPPSPSAPPPPPPPSSPPSHIPNGFPDTGAQRPSSPAPPSRPPPPSVPPPPRSPQPPPPAEVPHDRSPISIKLPSAAPHEPKLAPPPLPPSEAPLPETPSPSSDRERENEGRKGREEKQQEREREREREREEVPRPPSSAPPPLPPSDLKRPIPVSRLPSSQNHTRPISPGHTSNYDHYTHAGRPVPSRSSSRRSPSPPPRSPTPTLPDGVTVTYKRAPGRHHPQRLFSVHAPDMPPRSSYMPANERDHKVLFDSVCDKDRYGEMKSLMDLIRAVGKGEERIKDQGKGKVILYRYEGEVVPGEIKGGTDEQKEQGLRVSDPRKGVDYRPPKVKAEFHPVSYEYDSNTPGPLPPTNILIFGFSELTPTPKIRQHFQKYGAIVSLERELDRVTGGQMGVASVTYSSHEEAKRAVEGEEGKNFSLSASGGAVLPTVGLTGVKGAGMDKDSVKVCFDGDGKLLKLVLALHEDKRKREKEKAATTTTIDPSRRPFMQADRLPRRSMPNHTPHSQSSLPPHPHSHAAPAMPPRSGPYSHFSRGPGSGPGQDYQNSAAAGRYGGLSTVPGGMRGPGQTQYSARRQPPPSLVRARAMNTARSAVPQIMPPSSSLYESTPTGASEATDSRPLTPVHANAMQPGRGGSRGLLPGITHHHRHYRSHSRTPDRTSTSTPRGSRSPSPVSRARRPESNPAQTQAEKEAKHRNVMQALAKNGFDHARIDEKQLSGGAAREEDVREFFKSFPVDEVLHDYMGWYITFRTPDAASRAARVLAIGTHTLANRSVSLSVHPPPPPEDVNKTSTSSPTSLEKSTSERRVWKPEEMVEESGKRVLTELRALLEKDVMERIVSAQIRKMISESREQRRGKEGEADKTQNQVQVGYVDDWRGLASKHLGEGDRERERQLLKSLSFKKRKQKVGIEHGHRPEHQVEPQSDRDGAQQRDAEHEPESENVGRVVTQAEEEPLVAVTLAEANDKDEQMSGRHERRLAEKDRNKDRDKDKGGERPRKRRKKAELPLRIVKIEREVESEDDEPAPEPEGKVEPDRTRDELVVLPPAGQDILQPELVVSSSVQRKRSRSPTPLAEPLAKRSKVAAEEDHVEDKADVEVPIVTTAASVKSKKSAASKKAKQGKTEEKKTTKRQKKAKTDRTVLETLVIPPQMEVEAPSVAEVRVSPPAWTPIPSPEPSRHVVTETQLPSPKRYSPLPDSVLRELVEDDEDLYLAKLALSTDVDSKNFKIREETLPSSHLDAPPHFRKHATGSARSEGYYKISHAEKSAYVAQYAVRGAASGTSAEKQEVAPQQPVVSSRSNRANARRRAQGLEEMNQLQLAVALSKGESAATEMMKFNQLQTRKKHLRFARSPIHDWGLYAMERISRGEMVIEYVGEVIRAAIADKREKAYERQGIGSSYLFRIDEDLVVDATKKGNLGRLINHSCDPNCTAKIITINGEKKIVIYAKQDIELGDEITYDYHFPIEQDKIPCLCGSVKCRGFLN